MLLISLQLIDGIMHWKRRMKQSTITSTDAVSSTSSSSAATVFADDLLLSTIIDNCQLVALVKCRRVSTRFRAFIDRKLQTINYIDVRIEQKQSTSNECVRRVLNSSQHDSSTHLFVLNASNRLSIIILDRQCRSRSDDISRLLSIIAMFRHHITTLHIDLPIFGTIVSEINKQQMKLLLVILCRRFQQCDSNESTIVVDDSQLNSCFSQGDAFFPKLRQLTIRAAISQLNELSQIAEHTKIDHELLFTNRSLDLFCLNIVGGCKSRRRRELIFRHLANFRCWAATDQLGERFIQQFSNSSIADHCVGNCTTNHTTNRYHLQRCRYASRTRRRNSSMTIHCNDRIRLTVSNRVEQHDFEIIAG